MFLLACCCCCFAGQAWAWSDNNCRIFPTAYKLPGNSAPSVAGTAAPGASKTPRDAKPSSPQGGPAASPTKGGKMLLALTVVPPSNAYLYGPDSKEGLPTRLEAVFAPLSAYPMSRLSGKEIGALLEKKGKTLSVRTPAAPLKKSTAFASVVLPGNPDSNPPIYPGPVTFWVEVPTEISSLGGVIVQARLSGLICSASSCTPASGTVDLDFSASEIEALPMADQQSWWATWSKGDNILIEPPADALNAMLLENTPSAFSGGKSLTPSLPPAPEEDDKAALARHTAVFSMLDPEPFNPSVEVQYLGEALLLGLAAGLLLNLMPCVLPVVSLKFSALMAVTAMTDKREQARAFKLHCLVFALGIVVWFLILALLLGVAGWAWGELFQEPIIIVGLGMVLFVLGLSLFGVFSLPIFDLKVTSDSHPHWQSFGSGLLATLLATPCSGPLLGGVLAWAIRQPLPVLTLTVASVGIGMALPYLLLAFSPRLVHLLPRPGTWTIRLEQLLGFFLMGSVVYLATLLPGEWIPAFLFNLFAVALAAWLWGQIGHLRASRLRRGISRVLAVAVVVLAAWWGNASIHPDTSWEPFDPENFSAVLGKEPLLLEFTADWCPSCKALEHTTLTKKRMADLRKKYNVRTIRVDLTRDAAIGKELLKALNSTSIPVLALFPKGESAKQPLVLRDLVTPKQLKEAASRAFSEPTWGRFSKGHEAARLPDDMLGIATLNWRTVCPISPFPNRL